MVNVVNKTCSKCKTNLPAAFFYKKEKSADGLQDWCKYCQSKYNSSRLNKNNHKKHVTDLKRVSAYGLEYGLEYKFVEPKKWGKQRNKIEYKCLCCGKSVTSTIETAWVKKFRCNSCNTLDIPIKKKDFKKCNCGDHIKEQDPQPTGFVNFEGDTTRVFILPVLYDKPNEIVKQVSLYKKFVNWLKKLINKK